MWLLTSEIDGFEEIETFIEDWELDRVEIYDENGLSEFFGIRVENLKQYGPTHVGFTIPTMYLGRVINKRYTLVKEND